jgi:peptidoglycan hydrolase-like protein with peptidoglycan-binding domain
VTAATAATATAMPAEADMTDADRRRIQEALRRLGYYRGPIDGIIGPLTRAAIHRFQQEIGSEPTGALRADQATRLVLTR